MSLPSIKISAVIAPEPTKVSDLLDALSPQSKLFFAESEDNALLPGIQAPTQP